MDLANFYHVRVNKIVTKNLDITFYFQFSGFEISFHWHLSSIRIDLDNFVNPLRTLVKWDPVKVEIVFLIFAMWL